MGLCLLAQTLQQFRAGNAGETRIVVALGNQCGPAMTAVDHQDISAIAGQVHCRSESGRASTDHKTIYHLIPSASGTGAAGGNAANSY